MRNDMFLTLADLAVPNTLDHIDVFGIITSSKSILDGFDVGLNVSLIVGVETSLRAVGAVTLDDLCSGHQYDIHQRYSTPLNIEGKPAA
jgi:hypothetical protein